MNTLDTASRVIQTEIEGLQALAASIGAPFEKAIETIDAMKEKRTGRLIVAGIGKSGHIARKIAATMASTGTPAYFVHPGEASHGDMGMITESDVVLMLSNSGENAELSDLIHYTRRYGIPLIAITSKAKSTLGKHADITLLLPGVPEACPNGMAPTTSTTMMLALGDMIAITLLESMGLTKDQYKVLHPGGKLGQRLMKVSELMHQGDALPCIAPDVTMEDALLELTGKNLGCILVTKDTTLEGIITDGDLKRHMAPDLLQKSVFEIMTPAPATTKPDVLAAEALNFMLHKFTSPITCLPVVEDKKLVGLIRVQDCLAAGVS